MNKPSRYKHSIEAYKNNPEKPNEYWCDCCGNHLAVVGEDICASCIRFIKCEGNSAYEDLLLRHDNLLEWIDKRVAQCRIDEQKFGASQVAIDAARERMLLLEVLGVIK